jgi:hypothetical protein
LCVQPLRCDQFFDDKKIGVCPLTFPYLHDMATAFVEIRNYINVYILKLFTFPIQSMVHRDSSPMKKQQLVLVLVTLTKRFPVYNFLTL